MRYRYDIRCSICGKFCKPVDSGVCYDTHYSPEPPDEEFFCYSCVIQELLHPERIVTGCWWHIPVYVEAVRRMRQRQCR